MQIVIVLFRFLLSVLMLSSSPQQPIRRMTDEVRRRKQQRLDVLQEQAATYGLDVPPHITTEIEDLRDELETVDLLANDKLDRTTREAASKYDPRHLILQVRTDLSRRIRAIEESLRADSEQRHLDRSRGSFIIGILAAMMFLVLILVIILLIVGLR